jgi:A/G-specific adenine glycosylase
MSSLFAKHILQWQHKNPRPLPWDGGPRDPYHIWISEIIMQQTRIEQGASHYLKFILRFPTLQSLASASQDEVLRYWQGLGYYTRARNLHKAARYIMDERHGKFPSTYEDLLHLPGVGPYSAAAIASFAYGLSFPVVDGNVKRVITRFAGITSSIDERSTHEQIQSLASVFMKGVSPGEFNQAIMNFGALVCKPGIPDCLSCPLSKKCFAFHHNLVKTLPVRTKKKTNSLRHFHFIVIQWRGKVFLERRVAKDIWNGLFTPPLIEKTSVRTPSMHLFNNLVSSAAGHQNFQFISSSEKIQQQLSHQTIVGRFHFLQLHSAPVKPTDSAVWVSKKTVHEYGRPKMIVDMVERMFER